MLTFGHPESSWRTLGTGLDAGRVYGHSRTGFLFGNAYIWPPRESSGALQEVRLYAGGPMATRTVPFCLEMFKSCHPESSGTLRNALDARRVTGHSHNAFLFGNAYILPPRELGGTRAIPWTREGHMATRTMLCCLEMVTYGHPESPGAFRNSSTRGGPMATRTMPFCLEMLTFGYPESSRHVLGTQLPARFRNAAPGTF